jgi:hypothetical protein
MPFSTNLSPSLANGDKLISMITCYLNTILSLSSMVSKSFSILKPPDNQTSDRASLHGPLSPFR